MTAPLDLNAIRTAATESALKCACLALATRACPNCARLWCAAHEPAHPHALRVGVCDGVVEDIACVELSALALADEVERLRSVDAESDRLVLELDTLRALVHRCAAKAGLALPDHAVVNDPDAAVEAVFVAEAERLRALPRPGQVLFNALADVDPAFAESIRGVAGVDPFHHDAAIPDALRAWRRSIARVLRR